MSNALTILTPNDILTTARALIASGFLPKSVDTVDKAFAIITMSQELGIGMWQGLNGINVIQGKPTVSPQLMLALINRSGQLEDMAIEATAEFARVTLKRKGRTPHTETFTIKDAAAQGLTGKDNYRKQPATMLKWRAVAAAARVVFPDAIMGLYTVEEIAPDAVTVTEDGEATYTPPVVIEHSSEIIAESPLPQTVMIEGVTRKMKKDNTTDYYVLDCMSTQPNSGERFTAYTYSRDLFLQAGYRPAETWSSAPLGETFVPHYGLNAVISHNGKAWSLSEVFLTDEAAGVKS